MRNLGSDNRSPAAGAKFRRLHVEPFHGVARRHDAIPILAVPQSKRVPELMDGFFRKAFNQQFGTARLGQPVVRNHRAVSFQLRLAKDERQHRDKQIDGRDAQHTVLRRRIAEPLQERGGIVLIAIGIECEMRIQPFIFDVARNFESAREIASQAAEQIPVGRIGSDPNNVDRSG